VLRAHHTRLARGSCEVRSSLCAATSHCHCREDKSVSVSIVSFLQAAAGAAGCRPIAALWAGCGLLRVTHVLRPQFWRCTQEEYLIAAQLSCTGQQALARVHMQSDRQNRTPKSRAWVHGCMGAWVHGCMRYLHKTEKQKAARAAARALE
jgi:hypothetical protein